MLCSLRHPVERSPRGGHPVVLQGVQRQVRGRHQGGRTHPGGNGQPADGLAGVRRGTVQPGSVRGDQKLFRGRPDRRGDPAGHSFPGNE